MSTLTKIANFEENRQFLGKSSILIKIDFWLFDCGKFIPVIVFDENEFSALIQQKTCFWWKNQESHDLWTFWLKILKETYIEIVRLYFCKTLVVFLNFAWNDCSLLSIGVSKSNSRDETISRHKKFSDSAGYSMSRVVKFGHQVFTKSPNWASKKWQGVPFCSTMFYLKFEAIFGQK